jgi:hypothetical protein
MPWSPQSLPTYVERGGRQVWRPPYHAGSAEVYGFLVPADPKAIDLLVQRDLVQPAAGALDFRCAHPNVVVTVATIDRLSSSTAPDALRGYVPERELSIWCLLADKTAKERLVWYLPYVFTDSGQTTATGREVYGYPKQVGQFDPGWPGVLAKAGTTTVSGLGIGKFGPQQGATTLPMLSVQRLPGPGKTTQISGPGWAAALAQNLVPSGLSVSVNGLFGPAPSAQATITPSGQTVPPVPSPPPWLKPVVSSLTGSGLTGKPEDLIAAMLQNPSLVFLKQFRDVQCPTKACYQAVVEAPIAVDPVGATLESLDPALFNVTVHDWDTHPIASELGLAGATALTPVSAFRAAFSFDVMTGTELWRAPT